ncbi:hypothetical protein BsWGS_06026 [Bradybaena similaris]
MSSKRRRNDKVDNKHGQVPTSVKLSKKNTDISKHCLEATELTKNGETLPQTLSTPCTKPLASSSADRLRRTFFDVPCVDLARTLLGKHLVRMVGTERVTGRIVETEAYLGLEDKAAHSYNGKRTERNEAMFMQPGTAYVYNIYGMYCCLNISSQGDGCAVLLRALEPLENIELMRTIRGSKSAKKQKDKEMTNGPSKLCQALQISKQVFNQIDLTSSDLMWLEKGDDVDSDAIISCPRINIGYADDWKEKPLRFYVLGNYCVSVKDKVAEQQANV